MQPLPLGAKRDVGLSGVWSARLSQGELLQAERRLRGRAAQYRLRRRYRHVPRGHQQLRDSHPGQARLPLGQRLPGQLWRGG